MPWQAQLFIGQKVGNWTEVRSIMTHLGLQIPAEVKTDKDLEEFFWDGESSVMKTVECFGETYEVNIEFRHEFEGGCDFPSTFDPEYTDAVVAFHLTSRYAPSILDRAHSHGRPEPFEFDPEDITHMLKQVRVWWPEAKAIIWDIWY